MSKIERKIKEYFKKKKEVYDTVLEFIEGTDSIENDFEYLKNNFNKSSIIANKEEIEHFLQMLSSISNHHHRNFDLFTRIERLFEYFEEAIKQTFSKHEIFTIFMKNRKILLFLFNKKIITPDESYVKYFDEQGEPNSPRLCHFFYPEIREFISDEKREEIEKEIIAINENNFDDYFSKRFQGENDSYLCSLIRTDSVEEFISYYNKRNFSLNKRIEPSIFETNPFLINKHPRLIEYSAFYGSIQIFTFLQMNNVELESSLWLYSIHSNNPDIIHRLETLGIEPNDGNYSECLKESIKCHHNDISNYIENNLLKKKEKILMNK